VQGTEYAIVNWPDLLKIITAHEIIQFFLARDKKKTAMEAAGGAARSGDTDMLVNEPAVDVAPPADVSAATDGVLPVPIAAAASSSALVVGPRFVKVPASFLAKQRGFCDSDIVFNGKAMRVMGQGQTHKGTDISGLFVLSDAGAATIFEHYSHACRWANNAKIEDMPSLTFIDSGNINVNFVKVD